MLAGQGRCMWELIYLTRSAGACGLSKRTGEDTQTLLARALNDLFKAHNVPVVDQE